MKFAVEIEMDNSSFENPQELPRIVRELSRKLESARGYATGYVLDANGNTVGAWEIIPS